MLPEREFIQKVAAREFPLKAPGELSRGVVNAFCKRFGIAEQNIVGLVYQGGLIWNKENLAICTDRVCSEALCYRKTSGERPGRAANSIYYDEFLYLHEESVYRSNQKIFELFTERGQSGAFLYTGNRGVNLWTFLNRIGENRTQPVLDACVKAALSGEKEVQTEAQREALKMLKSKVILGKGDFSWLYYAVATLLGDEEICAALAQATATVGKNDPAIDRKATELYYLAAMRGHVPSIRYIAECYDTGSHGLKENSRKAMALYELAAKGGDWDSAVIVSTRKSGETGTGESPDRTANTCKPYSGQGDVFLHLHEIMGEERLFRVQCRDDVLPDIEQPKPISPDFIRRMVDQLIADNPYWKSSLIPVSEARGRDVRALCKEFKLNQKTLLALGKSNSFLDKYDVAVCTDRIYSKGFFTRKSSGYGNYCLYEDVFYVGRGSWSEVIVYGPNGKSTEYKAHEEPIYQILQMAGWFNVQRPFRDFLAGLARESGVDYNVRELQPETIGREYSDEIHSAVCSLLWGQKLAYTTMANLFLGGRKHFSSSSKTAFLLFFYGAQQGDLPAVMRLIRCYEQGEMGIEKNQNKAWGLRLYAAELGDAESAVKLAVALQKGDELPEDLPAANVLLQRYAKNESSGLGLYQLGMNTLYGYGLEVNKVTAMEYFKGAADKEYPGAKEQFRTLYKELYGYRDSLYKNAVDAFDRGEYDAAVGWAKRAIDFGSRSAKSLLGWMRYTGQGLRKDVGLAFEYAKNGNPYDTRGCIILGDVYYYGLAGEEVSPYDARIYYLRASEGGSSYATFQAAMLYGGERCEGVTHAHDSFKYFYKAMANENDKNRAICRENLDKLVERFNIPPDNVYGMLESLAFSNDGAVAYDAKQDLEEYEKVTKSGGRYRFSDHFMTSD